MTLPPCAPAPIATGLPVTLFTMITAIAPAFSAANILYPNSHIPLLITTILPSNSSGLEICWHPSCKSGSNSLILGISYNSASSPVSGSSLGRGFPKPAGTPK